MTLNPITSAPEFRECPACGTPMAPESAACAHCGALAPEATQVSDEAATEYGFLRALFTRSNPFTMIFIGINVGVFVLMCLAGGIAATSVDPEILRGFGAKQNDLIARQHEYWRLITSIFIHIGFIHLLLNNYALWIIGKEIEQIYGSARFVMLYLVTGVIGSLASYVFNPQATSAGASGAIFGLFGVMATFAFRYRREIPKMLSQEIRRRVLPVIAINLVFGFSVRIVDNAAHIGGLLSGVALALVVPYMRPNQRNTPLLWRGLQAVCLAAILISFVSAFSNYNGPQLSVSNLTTRPGSGVVNYFEQMKEGSRLLGESFNTFDSEKVGRNGSSDVQRAIDLVDQGLQKVSAATRIDPQADQYRKRLIELLTKQKNVLNEFAKSAAKDRENLRLQEIALIREAQQFISDYEKWLPGFLKERGYELRGSDDR